MNRLNQVLVNLRSSLWFVPGIMILGSIALALVLVEIDSRTGEKWLSNFPLAFGLGADGARGMLTAIASSMLTVAALTFSLTLNAVSQASGQFTPRIIRNFMRDRANQFVLGFFVSVFAFCLIVLRTIRGADEVKFVPSLAVKNSSPATAVSSCGAEELIPGHTSATSAVVPAWPVVRNSSLPTSERLAAKYAHEPSVVNSVGSDDCRGAGYCLMSEMSAGCARWRYVASCFRSSTAAMCGSVVQWPCRRVITTSRSGAIRWST